MQLDLVDGGDDLGLLAQSRDVMRQEAAHADRPDAAVREEGLEGAVGLDRALEVLRHRLVQDQHVDPIDAELRGTLLEGVQRLVVAVVADPHLGLEHHVVAVEAGRRTASPTSRSLP